MLATWISDKPPTVDQHTLSSRTDVRPLGTGWLAASTPTASGLLHRSWVLLATVDRFAAGALERPSRTKTSIEATVTKTGITGVATGGRASYSTRRVKRWIWSSLSASLSNTWRSRWNHMCTLTQSTRIVARVSSTGSPGHPNAGRLCAVAAEVTEMSGAGIMLMVGNEPHTSICTTGAVSAVLLEELQYTLGEGPCVDAYRLGQPVFEPDLRRAGVTRWPAFADPAVQGGARAVFGFPMSVGSVRLGALNLYRDGPGAADDRPANGRSDRRGRRRQRRDHDADRRRTRHPRCRTRSRQQPSPRRAPSHWRCR